LRWEFGFEEEWRLIFYISKKSRRKKSICKQDLNRKKGVCTFTTIRGKFKIKGSKNVLLIVRGGEVTAMPPKQFFLPCVDTSMHYYYYY